jgi:hypothetical protein
MTPQAARSVLRAIAGPSTFRELSCKHASDHALSLSTDLAMSQRRESFHGAIENGARLVQGKDLLLDQLFESSGANDAASKARSYRGMIWRGTLWRHGAATMSKLGEKERKELRRRAFELHPQDAQLIGANSPELAAIRARILSLQSAH